MMKFDDMFSMFLCDINALGFLLKFRQQYLDTLYRYAKFQYECGNYSGAAEYLYFFRVLVSLPLLSLCTLMVMFADNCTPQLT